MSTMDLMSTQHAIDIKQNKFKILISFQSKRSAEQGVIVDCQLVFLRLALKIKKCKGIVVVVRNGSPIKWSTPLPLMVTVKDTTCQGGEMERILLLLLYVHQPVDKPKLH